MTDDFFYLDEGNVRITAASVGISSKRWICIDDSESHDDRHSLIMKDKRFDVLPIIPENKAAIEFFKTKEPNKYDNILKEHVSDKDVLPCETLIREIIKGFATEDRVFYFLSHQDRITGLITLSNLNCHQVQVYIFELICNLERRLSEFIDFYVKPESLEEYLKEKMQKNSEAIKAIWENYQSDIQEGLDNKLIEYLYLSSLFNVIGHFNLNTKIDYSNNKWNDLGGINKLRNSIAHPIKSLLNGEDNVKKLWERIRKIEDLTFHLNQWREKR